MEMPLRGILRKTVFNLSAFKFNARLPLLMISLMLISFGLRAQVATYYNFSQSSGTFTPGISSTSTTPASVFATSWDDVSTIYPLPFNFTYNGTLYTAAGGFVGVDADGWITFSNGSPTMTGQGSGGSWVSISDQTGVYLNGTGNNNGFAGLNCDLNEQTFATFTGSITNGSPTITGASSTANLLVGTRLSGTGIPDGTIVVSVVGTTVTMSANASATSASATITPRSSIYAFTKGTAPNRQFVIQWTQAKRYSSSGENINFQMILNEGNANPTLQTLQVMYGTCTATSATAMETQVGLRGATTADFNARKSSTGWAATIAATANTDLVRFSNTLNPAPGLTFTWSPCTVAPGAAGAITGATSTCPNTTQVYSIAAVAGATTYTWTYSGTNTTFTATTTTPTNTFNFSSTATSGNISVTPSNLCGVGTGSSLSVTITSVTPATISYPLASYCSSASGTVSPTLSGPAGGTYSASPAGLTIVGATGVITPGTSTAGTYTVTYTYTSSGCPVTATTTVAITASPVVTTTVNPAQACVNSPVQITAFAASPGNYSVISIPYSSLTPSGSPTSAFNIYADDLNTLAIALPFAFNYYGAAITQFYINTNGHIQLQSGVTPGYPTQTIPDVTTPNNVIALAWDDLVVDPGTNTGSNVRYFMNGLSPNRVMVIEYTNLRFIAGSGSQNVTGQIRLYENDNHIEVAAGSVNDNGSLRTKTLGIENSTGTVGVTPAGRNNAVWNVSNEAWAFYPPVGTINYSWSPSTYLSSTSIANPVSTPTAISTTVYTVTATNSVTGCAGTATATVTAAAPLNGTYTVGIGGNYTTLTAAINAYNSLCIGGPVTFSLIDNSYPSETFPIIINSNVYASATNTLTIKPAIGKTPLITGSSASSLIQLNGADYVTFDGSNAASGTSRNLTITNSAASANTVIWISSASVSNGANNNTIKNCIVNGASNSGTIACIMSGSSVTAGNDAEFPNDNNTIQNDTLYRAQNGLYIRGNSTSLDQNWLITQNGIGSASVAADKMGFRGIAIINSQNFNITKNIVNGVDLSTSGFNAYGIATYLNINTGNISENKVTDIKHTSIYGAHGIYLGAATTASNLTVQNNFVFDIAAAGFNGFTANDNGYGISVNSGGGYKIYYNTVMLNTSPSVSTTNHRSAAMLVTSGVTTASSIDMRNNIFANTQTIGNPNSRYAILSTAANSVYSNTDYNEYYSPNSTNLLCQGSNATTYTTIALLRTNLGSNLNSINVVPTFVSTTDYHLQSAAGNSVISNLGTPISGITIDYDTQTRNGLTPDMGADEFVMPNYGSWVGKVSIDWLVPANWEANFVPDLTTDVYITGGYTFMPTIVTTQAVRGLTLNAPVPANTPILTLNAGTLQVYGTIIRTGGNINGSNGTMEMKGSAFQSIPASLFVSNNLKNLIISNTETANGVVLGGPLDIYRSVTFGAGGRKLTTANALTFKSTATETAWLGQMTASNVITGSATVERYIPLHNKAWQFLAVPATGQTVNAAWQEGNAPLGTALNPGYGTIISNNVAGTGFDIIGGVGPSMKTYVPATNLWQGIANTTIPIANQKGYMLFVRGNRTVQTYNGANTAANLRTKGTLYTPANPPPVTNVGSTQFESIGNPYASAIDFSNDIGVVKAGSIQKVFYVWDPKLGSGYGAYQTFTQGAFPDVNYYVTPGGGSYGTSGSMNNIIQSGQAFFVHTFGGTGTITINEAAKTIGSSIVNRISTSARRPVKQLRTNLYNVSNEKVLVDGNLIEFGNTFFNRIDMLDAIKTNNTGENLGLFVKGKLLSVERRSLPQRNDTLFYNLTGVTLHQYEFEFIAKDIDQPGLQAWLEDDYLHTSRLVSLNDTTRVQFDIVSDAGSYAVGRFRIVFRQKRHNDVPTVKTLITETGSSIPKVTAPADNPSISVSPNPVAAKTMQLQFHGQPEGNYSVRLMNKIGQQVYAASVSVSGNDMTRAIPLKGIVSGSYFLHVTGPDGNETTLQVIIQ